MRSTTHKYLLGITLLLFPVSMIFAQEGIILTGPILPESKSDTLATETEVADAQLETDFRLEVSEFAMVPKNDISETLKLVKIYDMKQPLGNSYILHILGHDKATIIDPGYNAPAIARYLETENLTPDAILLTNGSFYRIASNAQFVQQWPKIAIGVGEQDAGMLTDPKANQSESFGGIISPEPTIRFQGGERIETSSSIPWQVLDTPGFTPGSLSYQLDTKEKRLIFTGDFIYRDGIGGSQLPMGDAEAFDLSLQAFLEYAPVETLIYPGFGPNTTVGDFYNHIANDDEDGINLLAEGQTLSMPLTDTTSVVNYQNQIVEVYPTTTFVYSDFVIPRYYSPYYSYYHHSNLLPWGLHVWSWLPIRRPPPPPRHHHLHGPPSFWHGPGMGGRPNRPPQPGPGIGGNPNRPNRPPQPGPGIGGNPNRPPQPGPGIGGNPNRPPQPGPGIGGNPNRPNRPPQPGPGIGGNPNRPNRPPQTGPGIGGNPNRPTRPPQTTPGSTVRPDRPSRPIPTPGIGSGSNRPGRPSQPGLGNNSERPTNRPTVRPAERPTTRPATGLGSGAARPSRPTPAATSGSTRTSRPTPAATTGNTSRPTRAGGEARPSGGAREGRPERHRAEPAGRADTPGRRR